MGVSVTGREWRGKGAHVGEVAAGATDGSERNASAAHGALVDFVSGKGREEALFLGGIDDAEGDSVFGAVACTIEKLCLGKNFTASGLGKRTDLEERRIANGGFDALGNDYVMGSAVSAVSAARRGVVFQLDRRAKREAREAARHGGFAPVAAEAALDMWICVLEAQSEQHAGDETEGDVEAGARVGHGGIVRNWSNWIDVMPRYCVPSSLGRLDG